MSCCVLLLQHPDQEEERLDRAQVRERKEPDGTCTFSFQSQEPGELVTTTNRDYDLAEVSKSVRGILMGMGIVALMHFYFGYTNPYVLLC